MSETTKPSSSTFFSCGNITKFVILPAILHLAFVSVGRILYAGNPLSFYYPNLLLFTGYRAATLQNWKEVVDFSDKEIVGERPITELEAKDYSWDALKKATNNWKHPVVVRGLFNGTKALETWTKDHAFASRVGDFNVPVIEDGVFRILRKRIVMPLDEALHDIITNPKSKRYLFIPNHSRRDNTTLEGPELKKRMNEVILGDLDVERIMKPSYGPISAFIGTQFLAGQGSDSEETTTGTDWHCAIGSNYFIQIAGTKLWKLINPRYSGYMHPLKGGRVHIVAGVNNMHEYEKYLPVESTELRAGDMLYNPDWYWHSIKNRKGLTMGASLRELDLFKSKSCNTQYTAIAGLNLLLELLGLELGGYPVENDK